ncbi:MAG TPA: lamin tail domain-containing protein [Anaerolineaceae bacterium]|nr:lamin tail domain-containing protein [Anaerolineaceae bacterium]
MKKRTPILPYLLLNVLVSAGTIILVLFLWQKLGGGSLPGLSSPKLEAEPTQTAQQPTEAAPARQPAADAELSIEAVVGVGNRDLEYILVRNQSETAVDLAGWELSGSGGERYTFPALRLNKNGAVRLYSRTGTDSVIELFWNSAEALWETGEEIVLSAPDGSAQCTYLLP